MNTILKLISRYPRFHTIIQKQQDNSVFFCFFLRIISFLPGDIVTMYLGATKVSYTRNLFPGLLGLLPGMILATLTGAHIQDPTSPMLWISAGLTAVFAAFSALLYYFYCRRLHRKEMEKK